MGQYLLAIWSTYLEPYCSLIWMREEVHVRPRPVLPQGWTCLSAARRCRQGLGGTWFPGPEPLFHILQNHM